MFTTLFKRKRKVKSDSPSASEFLKQPHVQEYMARVRGYNKEEADDNKMLDEWVRRKDEALKNVDMELLAELCDVLVDNHRSLTADWYNTGRRSQKTRAKFRQLGL